MNATNHEVRSFTSEPRQAVARLDINDPRRKNPALAGILSAMPGLGQVYIGYYTRGFVHIIVVASMTAFLANNENDTWAPSVGFFLAFFWLYNIVDAVRRAALYNQVLAGGEQPPLPDDFEMPSLGGSILGGVLLMAAGLVLLLHTRFGMPLEFLEEWWPLVPMGFGAYLLGKAIKERSARREP